LGASVRSSGGTRRTQPEGGEMSNILWIVLIVVIVLALLGFFGRGRW
jgi:flagellar basal body-associated protein FliL